MKNIRIVCEKEHILLSKTIFGIPSINMLNEKGKKCPPYGTPGVPFM